MCRELVKVPCLKEVKGEEERDNRKCKSSQTNGGPGTDASNQ